MMCIAFHYTVIYFIIIFDVTAIIAKIIIIKIRRYLTMMILPIMVIMMIIKKFI